MHTEGDEVDWIAKIVEPLALRRGQEGRASAEVTCDTSEIGVVWSGLAGEFMPTPQSFPSNFGGATPDARSRIHAGGELVPASSPPALWQEATH